GGGEDSDTAEPDTAESDTAESGSAAPDTAKSDDRDGPATESERGRPEPDQQGSDTDEDVEEDSEGGTTRRRRRRRRRGEGSEPSQDDPANTVVRIRERRAAEDEISSISGSTRLEAKKQRRREGRDAGRRRAPIVSESEFLARRESVKREMVIRQREDLSQIAVLEDGVLVEHYVARESQTSLIGNVYLGRVQNVLPSMEAAFIDVGKGRNAVLYAGEVDWKAVGAEGRSRKIEEVLKSGQSILVQVTKDPVGNKGARLTGQVSLPGRFLVYVPGGQSSGISRKLPDTERARLKALLKDTLPEGAGVIIRTAAEGASEEQLTRDVSSLTARWQDIESKAKVGGNAPQLLYGEPDLTIKVVRDLFNEDFGSLVVQGDDAWDMIDGYVTHVAPDLSERLSRWEESGDHRDAFAAHRIDEQIAKGLDRKVWLPSGGSLVIDRTEAMTVVDVNTGKFTGSGGNLEETVTKNNLEAAEEIVRQLRLRDIGGIIVVDFIDMVLEGNRDLVLRRMVECLGRDRTRHQVAEVTSLGLVQMTRKRIGTGLLEAFSDACEHCHGRGLVTHPEPVEPARRGIAAGGGTSSGGNLEDSAGSTDDGNGRRGRRGRGRGGSKRGEGDGERSDRDSTAEQGADS
ncbi:MAG: Rne/Rng family ribonuclease, partial [Actinomycetota bacterium]|nr:Rne/Rng family ribonuclease [Actinomycetota bacterium]